MKEPHEFPAGFLWGASTASHQVEGGTHNQWSEWETENADELARTAGKSLGWLPEWDRIKASAEDPRNYISGKGVEHYTRYREDFDIIEELGLNAFRFGIEWARVQPEEGEWDEAAIAHYHEYIDEMKRRGIEPVLNLWHWTMPTWFTDKGGFEHSDNVRFFSEFVGRMAKEYASKVKYVLTLNEPNVYTGLSYIAGEWVPQYKNIPKALTVYGNLVRGHKQAYALLKKANPDVQVGIAAQLANNQPKRPGNVIDETVARAAGYASNWWFLDRIRGYQDFVGINYYFTDYYQNHKKDNPKKPVSDLGWYMEPAGIARVLEEASDRYSKPILITENGLADAEDKHRKWWLEETMGALKLAMADGVNLIGYLHWSLLDNFEWKFGWWPKFGLVEVDREDDMRRSIRPSAYWYADFIRESSGDSGKK
jgi:beta-glucosidase